MVENPRLQIAPQCAQLSRLGRELMLRPAQRDDAAAVAQLLQLSRRHFLPYLPDLHSLAEMQAWVANTLIPSGGVSLALATPSGDFSSNSNATPSLFGVLALSRDASGCGWIDQLYLHPDAVGHGLGSLLMQHAKQLLGAPMRLYTFQANSGARRFYRGQGFNEIAFSDGQDNEEGWPDVLLEWLGEA